MLELDQFYKTIEKDAVYFMGIYPIQGIHLTKNKERILPIIEKLKKIIKNSNSSDISRKKAQLELDCFNFKIKNGKIEQFIEAYPDIKSFDDADYEYIENRIENTKNSIIKSRYATILWNRREKRDPKYARIAINENLKIIKKLESDLNPSDSELISHYLINSYVLSKMIENKKQANNNKNKEITNTIGKWINDPSLNKNEYFYLKYYLGEFIIKQKKIHKENFEEIDLNDIDDNIWKLAEDIKINNNHRDLFKLIELGEKINNINPNKSSKWTKLKVESYEEFANEKGGILKLEYIKKAIDVNKKLNNQSKEKELTNEYDKHRKEYLSKLPEIKFEVHDSYKLIPAMKEAAEKMSANDSETILTHLMKDNNFLAGNYKYLTELSDEHKSSLFDLGTKIIIDDNGHIIKKYKMEKEQEQFKLKKDNNLSIYLISIYLERLMFCSIKKGKISSDIVINFIKNKTLVGKSSRQCISYLSPGITQYFQDYSSHLENPNDNPQFVLSIDSLVLKIEGLIRDLAHKKSISTTRFKKNDTSEKSLKMLLNEKELENIIIKDDLFFLKYLLTDREGLNLRNEVAHSLMKHTKYNKDNANLVILALFRLLKYYGTVNN